MLVAGDPVPSFHARSLSNPRYAFDTVAGRNIVMTFIGSTQLEGAADFIAQMQGERLFDDDFASAFIVTSDARDEGSELLKERYPGLRVFLDFDAKIATQFGSVRAGETGKPAVIARTWIIDPAMRVARVLPVTTLATHHADIVAALRDMPRPAQQTDSWAPVLVIPNVLEPELCREYLAYAAPERMQESGFMRTDPKTGETILVNDHSHKRRVDCSIDDERLRRALSSRVQRRIAPAIERAFQFRATRMERYIISCYDAGTGGYFRPHKDNTTLGTAHRRFAVSIGLNAEDYEGGDLRFPEYGRRTYRPPTGGAVVFSCSVLHEALPVTRGRRFVILPFLYDEAAARIRRENAQHLQDEDLRRDVLRSIAADREEPAGQATAG